MMKTLKGFLDSMKLAMLPVPPSNHSRKGRKFKHERLYRALTPKGTPDIRVLPSNSAYRVARNGAWVRINHPRNKHDRRATA